MLYNGIDFPYSIPTGRFSNGYNTADQIARQFGYMESPPSFLVLTKRPYSFKRKILGGANFASAGSGILTETGRKQWGEVTFLEKQVQQFKYAREKISEKLGEERACKFVSNSLFLISVGSNDLFDFARNYTSIHDPQQYLAALQLTYFQHIKSLYGLGARKFGILSIPPIGCCPALTSQNKGDCVKPLNDLAIAFYSATSSLLQNLSSQLLGFKYSFGNTFLMTKTLLDAPSNFGLKETKSACCGIGYLNGQGPCNNTAGANVCYDRKSNLFWDWFHPTEKASELAAKTLVHGNSTQFVSPINLSQLAGA
ncbi:hypothetical protein PIB30_071069 [Stylosanthes scabra]|uniref:Uncharacterized protein n=1 Tax=Stylosanthes scabra TaxID=79078 RepID=A0ABU6TNB3_9FABA|nr:hypothetical protein [Stylosanthes scabra]